MSTTVKHIDELLTGSEETDSRIRDAYELGLQLGRAVDRDNLQRCAKIDTTRKLLATLMRSQSIDLQKAMVTLQIPKAERKTYARIFTGKQKR